MEMAFVVLIFPKSAWSPDACVYQATAWSLGVQPTTVVLQAQLATLLRQMEVAWHKKTAHRAGLET
jgi:hypothetical protein